MKTAIDKENTGEDTNNDVEDHAKLKQKFNLVVDGLKDNKDVFIAKILITWIDYKLVICHPPEVQEGANFEKEHEAIDLDKHLLEDQEVSEIQHSSTGGYYDNPKINKKNMHQLTPPKNIEYRSHSMQLQDEEEEKQGQMSVLNDYLKFLQECKQTLHLFIEN